MKYETDQDELAKIWDKFLKEGYEPTDGLRLLCYQVLSNQKPEGTYTDDDVKKFAFMPVIYDMGLKNYASRKFFESKLEVLEWYSNKYEESIVGKEVIFKKSNEDIGIGWDAYEVYVEMNSGHYQLVGIMDGLVPDHEANYDAHFHAKERAIMAGFARHASQERDEGMTLH